MKKRKRFGAALAVLLSGAMLFGSVPMTAFAAETDDAETGAPVQRTIDIYVANANDLREALWRTDETNLLNIWVEKDITGYVGTKGDNTMESYTPVWCTLGKGKKHLYLKNHKIDMENDYVVTVSNGTLGVDYIETVNTQTLFSIPQGADLTVSSSTELEDGNKGRIYYNGVVLKDRDGVDNRDIFHVDGGKLTINSGEFSTEFRERTYEYGYAPYKKKQHIQVNGTPVTVNSGVAVINGGYFEGRGFEKYLYRDMPLRSRKEATNAALEVNGGMAIINGGFFYGDNMGYAVKLSYLLGHNAKKDGYSNNLIINAGDFGCDEKGALADDTYSTEKGEKYMYWGMESELGLPVYKYMPYHNIYDYDGKIYDQTYFDENENGLEYVTKNKLHIDPKGSIVGLPNEPSKEVDFYLGDRRYNPSGGEYLRWVPGKDYEFTIDPETLTFFGMDPVGNSYRATSDLDNYHLSAMVNVYQHISDGNRPVIATGIPASCTLGDDGKWKLKLSDILSSSGWKTVENKLASMPDQSFDFYITFTETKRGTYGNTGWLGSTGEYYCNAKPTGEFYLYTETVPEVYTVSFNANGGSDTMKSVKVTEGEQYTLPSCGFTAPKDMKFALWSVNGAFYAPGEKIDINKDTLISAIWARDTYRVTFYSNDSQGKTDVRDVERNRYYTLPGCPFAPASQAKEFSCWRIYDGSNYVDKKPGEEVLINKNTNIYAQWVDDPDHKLRSCAAYVNAPVVGEKPSDPFSLWPEKYDPFSLEPEKYSVRCEGWYYNGPDTEAKQKTMGPDDVFEEGRIYWMKYRFIPNYANDYEFDSGNAHLYMNGKEYEDAEIRFELPVTLHRAEVYVTAPCNGDKPVFKATLGDSAKADYRGYRVDTTEKVNFINGVSWYNNTDGKTLGENDTFEAGKDYVVSVKLKAIEPNVFAEDREALINGWDCDVLENTESSTITLTETFTAEGNSYPVWVGNTQVNEDNKDDILGDDGSAEFDPATNTLTLNDPYIADKHFALGFGYDTREYGYAIYSEGIDLTVKGNYIMDNTSTFHHGIRTKDGSLTLDGEFAFVSTRVAVAADKGLTLKRGTLVAECTTIATSAIRTEYGYTITLTEDANAFYATTVGKNNQAVNGCTFEFDADKFELIEPVNGVIKDNKIYEEGGVYEANPNLILKRIIELNDRVDKKTGVIVTLEDGVDLIVEDVTGNTEYGNIVISEGELIRKVYNITLEKNGEEVQPVTEVTVKIPWNGDPDAQVFRLEQYGAFSGMGAEYIDGYLVFTTSHFSVYMISEPAPDVMSGDVNGDGKVDVTDATLVQLYAAEMLELSDEQLKAADANSDGKVDVTDATYIQLYAAELIDNL